MSGLAREGVALAGRPVVVASHADFRRIVSAYFGARTVEIRESWEGSRRYLVVVERAPRRGYVVFDVTALFPAPAGQAERGSPTAGLGWAILAFAGLLGFIWLSRPETARR